MQIVKNTTILFDPKPTQSADNTKKRDDSKAINLLSSLIY